MHVLFCKLGHKLDMNQRKQRFTYVRFDTVLITRAVYPSIHQRLKTYTEYCNGRTLKNGCFLTSSASLSPAPSRLSGLRLRSSVENQILRDRKSTRLNSSHANRSYAVFCLKKKKKKNTQLTFDWKFKFFNFNNSTR